MNWLAWLLPSSDRVSTAWLRQADQRESRIEFHGVSFAWPIRKITNESPIWNKYRLRKSA